MMSQIMEANPAIQNAANCATKSIHQKVSDTQRDLQYLRIIQLHLQ
ncbi:unnamed protein product [Staurois parvus]|uniref:Uncharacterized protein n=1 Tax=Staurois parvus TaxID=386267 RepID=A0ABN9AFD2_9NEOB|nr:unnamed protein product [Staurois parvus]